MPPKKKGGKKGGKKKKQKWIGNETPGTIVKRLLKTYERNCCQTNTLMCPTLKNALKGAIEDDNLIVKFVVDPVEVHCPDDLVVSVEPVVNAVRQERYIHLKELYLWNLPLTLTDCSTISLLLEKGFYPIKNIELMNCLVDAYSAKRLAVAFNFVHTLSTIVFDYNEFGDAGCEGVCLGLTDNRTVISLSMCYCCLEKDSGRMLGHIIATTAVRELYIDGNDLEWEGCVELITACAEKAEAETYEREEAARIKAEEEALLAEMAKDNKYKSGSDAESKPGSAKKKKKKGKKKKKAKGPPPPPPVGPWIYKLHIADNGIDAEGSGGQLAPLVCCRLLRRLVTHSAVLEELDLDDNLIGDLGGRELMEGLYCRKEAGLNGVKLRTTHRMNPDTFSTLCKLGTGLKKKKKKGRKKKKK